MEVCKKPINKSVRGPSSVPPVDKYPKDSTSCYIDSCSSMLLLLIHNKQEMGSSLDVHQQMNESLSKCGTYTQ